MSELPPTIEGIVADLRLLRERGLVRIRHTDLAVLRMVADATGHGGVEALLRVAVENLGEGSLGAAAVHTFGLNRGARDRAAQDRRRRAAQEYGVGVERFRKHHERVVVEQVAEEILKLCQPPARQMCGTEPPELANAITVPYRAGHVQLAATVHIEPVELLHGVDVVVVPTNTHLEMPQPYKASFSAAIRRAAARRAPDGTIVSDVVMEELHAWIRSNGRPGLPVTGGTVVPTSPGALGRQGIRRLYHAAVVSPRPGTNDYDVDPSAIALAVRNAFEIIRSERELFSPRLNSVGFPLLGAGRGGLDRAVSFAWIRTAMDHEIRAGDAWDIHFITRQRAAADVIVAGLTQ